MSGKWGNVSSIKKINGFTLIELMIIIAIIGILAAIAVPQYNSFTSRAKFSEVVLATVTYKTAISVCAQTYGGISSDGTCTTFNSNGIPKSPTSAGYLDSILLDAPATDNAVITATSIIGNGLNGEIYILEGDYSAGRIVWSKDSSASCNAASLC